MLVHNLLTLQDMAEEALCQLCFTVSDDHDRRFFGGNKEKYIEKGPCSQDEYGHMIGFSRHRLSVVLTLEMAALESIPRNINTSSSSQSYFAWFW